MPKLRATTILAVRTSSGAAIGGDGQVTLGNIVMKADARKIRKLYDGKVLAGFAGAAQCLQRMVLARRRQDPRHLDGHVLPGPRAPGAELAAVRR